MTFLDRVMDTAARAPKFIDPPTHAALDYLVTSYFLLLGGLFWNRNQRAAATALINGFMVLGVSMFTDYPGGLKKISFRTHGKADVMQALTAAGLPNLLGFGNRASALPFRLQALKEALIITLTDFEKSGKAEARLRRAA